jgi:shikimate dehydrogenase
VRNFGLIGEKLNHSFSKEYFTKKFKNLKLNDYSYKNFEINNLSNIKRIIIEHKISGLNITIPFKEQIIPYLDKITKEGNEIKAINTIKIENDKLIGYNTDILGFEKSISPILKNRKKALILGNGGASKAVKYILNKKNIEFKTVSRKGKINYENLNDETIKEAKIIINTTPLGTFPNIKNYPNINYNLLTDQHLLYDLVYNPIKSEFLKRGEINGSEIKNGLEMLKIQADEAWLIWNS